MQEDLPGTEETVDIFRFLTGYGWWALLAVAVIIVVLYKKFRK